MKLSMMQNPALGDEYTAQDLVEPGSGATERAVSPYSPYVIGVTGHRNLAEGDLARVRGALVSFFDTIRQLLPDTELNVMLGMAAGGDLVVAETALALGISVQAVLPMPLAEFVVDFDDRNQRLLLELLAHRNLQYIELPLVARGESTRSTEALAGREAAYRNLTEVLNRKSNLMLALWDGKPSRRPGGTTDTVLRCLGVITNERTPRLQFTVADPEADTDSPFVYWMPIAPGGNDDVVAATSPCFLTALGDTILQFGSQPPQALQRRLAEFNDYNRDFRRVSADVRTAPSDSLLARVPTDLLGEDRPRLAQLNTEYGKADTLALHYQKRSDSLFGIFGIFAFVMGCIYLIYDKLGENQGVLLTYLTILLGSVVLYRLLYTKVWFVKHLQYRALAETLRISFYLCLAGVGRSVDAAEVLALSGIEGFEGFGWISDVLKNVAPMSSAPAPLLDPRLTEYVRTAWVDDQHRYFTRKVKQLEHKSKRVSRWQLAALVVTVVVLIIRLLFSHSLRTVYVTPGVPLKNQLAHFSRSSAELERTASPARQAEVLVELGKRSLMEGYLWTIHRYHREHAPPAGA